MDVIDSGADTAQLFLDISLRQQQAKGVLHPFTGYCYNCDASVEAPGCFCDTDCQEDFEKRVRTHDKTHYAPVVE